MIITEHQKKVEKKGVSGPVVVGTATLGTVRIMSGLLGLSPPVGLSSYTFEVLKRRRKYRCPGQKLDSADDRFRFTCNVKRINAALVMCGSLISMSSF